MSKARIRELRQLDQPGLRLNSRFYTEALDGWNEALNQRNEARNLVMRMLKAPVPKMGQPGFVAFKEALEKLATW